MYAAAEENEERWEVVVSMGRTDGQFPAAPFKHVGYAASKGAADALGARESAALGGSGAWVRRIRGNA